ncbi:MAG: ribulose-phosphate 3-epimerase [Candidatus Schekmanbacteria bacterium RBG_13_48_7]|uniref:Ribulose-phosphate 3-epimerase n=1 Tax=Candidatus Schekmanbacteria bacterium RBG_13_48_7 TaxID=1817878 RepID=A0A1F7RZU5_9BACT|nr:MAG: ribulose-phosphate 3-epimerase [Candidatus Schekmanbacteria bacterium RBG_13_48_7]
MREIWIAPSILSADFGSLASEVKKAETGGAHLIHVDVMDGHFVPNITIGPLVVKALKTISGIPLDVHLMITNPDQYIPEFIETGASWITVHWETCPHLHRTLQLIGSKGAKRGVALNPGTPVLFLEPVLDYLDLVLIMTVNPGFGGQKFIPEGLKKIDELKKMRDKSGCNFLIEVDGGVNTKNCGIIAQKGADILVAGSAVFNAPDPAQAVRDLYKNSNNEIIRYEN